MHALAWTGHVVADRYRLQDQIGHGAMGTVWRARDELLDRDVAVKEVMISPAFSPGDRSAVYERTLREAKTAARLNHPGVVTVFDVVEEDSRPWIIMELVQARSLDRVLAEDGPLPITKAADVGAQLVSALTTAHAAGVLHRDVKPSNVLLCRDGRAVLTDFGIATLEGDANLTQTGMVMGTPAFTPPERIRGAPATPASDLWSLGATLYAAVQGRGPYTERGGAITTMNAVINEDTPVASSAGRLGPVIEALMRKDPAARPDAVSAARMLNSVLSGGTADVPGMLGGPGLPGGLAGVPGGPGGSAPAGGGAAGEPWPANRSGSDGAVPAQAPWPASGTGAGGPAPTQAPWPAYETGAGGPPSPEAPAQAGWPANRTGTPGGSGPGRHQGPAGSPGPGRHQGPAGGPGAGGAGTGGVWGTDRGAPPYPPGGGSAGAYATPGGTMYGAPVAEAGAYLPPPSGTHSLPSSGPGGGAHASKRNGRSTLVACAALAVVAVGVLGGFAVTHFMRRAANESPSKSGSTQAAGHHGSSPAPSHSTTAPTTLPDGYTWYSLPAGDAGTTGGFRVAVPSGWSTSRTGLVSYAKNPSGSGFMEMDLTPHTFTDEMAEARWLQGKTISQGKFPHYRRISLKSTYVAGQPAAAWTFSWVESGAGRVVAEDYLFNLPAGGSSQSYAVYASAPVSSWSQTSQALSEAIQSFQPLS
jgi:tRNA A-37 threonylcarbamoyl transferase component Bud32